MKKSIIFVLLIATIAVLVGVSGCLDGGGNATNNTTNNTPPVIPSPPPEFDSNIVQIEPVPVNFELLAVKEVTANDEGIGGLTDPVEGFSATYMYNNSPTSTVYLYAFECESEEAALGYVLSMIDAHIDRYPGTYNVTQMKINGHDATLLTSTTQGSSGGERYELAWNNEHILVVVNGPAARNLIEAIATASNI
ncbi:MAG: hypothetical protein FWE54_01790 [Methanimicrococcus sp.]|nr:hypothetical protein [Methanimicrococcus sp.]